MSSRVPHRTRLVFATLTAVAVGGCGAASNSPTGSATATPAVSGSSASGPASTTIPTSAFFEMPADLRRDERTPTGGDQTLPRLCNDELAPGTGIAASAVMMHIYKGPNDPPTNVPAGVLYQIIRLHSADTATEFMNRVRDRMAACTTIRTEGITVQVQTNPLTGAGDEALTIDRVQPQRNLPGDLEPGGGVQTNRIVIIRIGTVVTILNDSEYERSSSVPSTVARFVEEATKAIRTWRK